jgi:ABC-type bacteriocin/lantibiotic exporter with double-glycine peptidase domain
VSLPLVQMVKQRHEADCGVAVLAMFLGESYENVLLAFSDEEPLVLHGGAWLSTIRRVSEKFGVPLKPKTKWDAEADEGIVQVLLRGPHNHYLLLREGLFFNTNASVWLPEDYYKARRAKPGKLLVRAE